MTTLLTTCITNLNQKLKTRKKKFNTVRCTWIKWSMLPLYKNKIAFLPYPPPKPEVKN